MSGNPENPDRREPAVQGPDTVVPFVPKSERVRPIIPRWESDHAPPPSGQGPAPGGAHGDEDGDDPGPTAA